MWRNKATLRMEEVSRNTGVSDQAIRFYERKGLIQPAGRSKKGHRYFTPESVEAIRLIKAAQSMGFSLDEIQVLLQAHPGDHASCENLQALLKEKLRSAREVADALAKVESEIVTLLQHAEQCGSSQAAFHSLTEILKGVPCERKCFCLGEGHDKERRVVTVRRKAMP